MSLRTHKDCDGLERHVHNLIQPFGNLSFVQLPETAVRKLPGAGGFWECFIRFSICFRRFLGVEGLGGGDMDLSLPWSDPGLETNKKLPLDCCSAS